MKISIALLGFLWAVGLPVQNLTDRFTVPQGYRIQTETEGSFGAYLQHLPLKPIGTPTKTYLGTIASTNAYTAAVINLSLGHEDLQQCADAVMRLRAEYLYQQKKYSQIGFHFTSGFWCDYEHFARGYRYHNDRWILKAEPNYSYATFLRYLNLVFSYAGTLSLDKELKNVNTETDLKAGDIFIKGGLPGHCFIVVNVAINTITHHKTFMLAQSYMPAQDIQVLKSPSPWYNLTDDANLPYGDLIKLKYLKRFD